MCAYIYIYIYTYPSLDGVIAGFPTGAGAVGFSQRGRNSPHSFCYIYIYIYIYI